MPLHAIRETLDALGHARVGYVLAALVLYAASVVIVAARWRVILTALGHHVRRREALLAYLSGICAGNVTPARTLGGDACRATLLHARTSVPMQAAATSVLYDRLSEAPAVAALALVALPALRGLASHAYLWLVGAFAALVLLIGVARAVPRLRSLLGTPIDRRALLVAIGCSFAVWLQDATRVMLVAAAFHVALTPSQAASLSVLAMLGGLAPIAGGIGVVEAGLIGGLVALGTPVAIAAAITVVERAISYGAGTAAGGVALVMGSYPLFWRRGVRKRGTTPSPAAAAALALALAAAAAPVRAAAPDATDWAAVQRFEAELRTNPNDLFEGAAYRQLMIRYGQYDRAIAFFRRLAADHRNVAPVHLNLAFAYIDKIPTVGRIRQGFLGRDAIDAFGTSIRMQPTWIAYYMRGLVNLYYDRILNRVRPAIADLEQAIRIQRAEEKQPFHVRAFISLGDAYWKLGDQAKARSVWSDGLNEFPGDAALAARLAAKPGPELYRVIETGLDASQRQDTSLRELARQQQP